MASPRSVLVRFSGKEPVMQNKKFAAFILSEFFIFSLMGLTICKQDLTWPASFFLSFSVVGAMALAIGFVLSEKSLVKFMEEIGDLRPGHKEDDDDGGSGSGLDGKEPGQG